MRVLSPEACGATRRHQRIHTCAECHGARVLKYASKWLPPKRLPLQPVSSERNHQVVDKFRKVSCLNVYGRKRGRVGVKQCMHSFHSLDCLLSVFFDDYMSKLFPIFYLANFVCFYPSKYKAFPPNINYIFLILPYTK